MSFLTSFYKSLFYPTLFLLALATLPWLSPSDIHFDHLDLSHLDLKHDFGKQKGFQNKLDITADIQGSQYITKGPESFALRDDYLYTGLQLGLIVRRNVNSDPSEPWEVVITTSGNQSGMRCTEKHDEPRCGRPLGMQFHNNGKLMVADAFKGVLEVDVDKKEVKALVPRDTMVNGTKIRYVNSVAVGKNDIYFTEASNKFDLHESLLECLTTGTGRLIRYDKSSGKTTALMSGLIYANGVALAPDESYVIVAETATGKIYKYDLVGSNKDKISVFAVMPGMADNIKPNNLNTGYIVGVIVPNQVDQPKIMRQLLFENKYSKKILFRILYNMKMGLEFLNSMLKLDFIDYLTFWAANTELAKGTQPKIGLLVEIDLEGKIRRSWMGNNEDNVCEGYQHNNKLYLGSPYRTGTYTIAY